MQNRLQERKQRTDEKPTSAEPTAALMGFKAGGTQKTGQGAGRGRGSPALIQSILRFQRRSGGEGDGPQRGCEAEPAAEPAAVAGTTTRGDERGAVSVDSGREG